jgi:hypothetical protein
MWTRFLKVQEMYGRGIGDFLSDPYVGKLAWVRRDAIVDSEQEHLLMRGSRSEYMSTVDVMSGAIVTVAE